MEQQESKKRDLPSVILRWLFRLLACGFVLLILLPLGLPSKHIYQSKYVKDLSNAKQIYLALRMYADDHDGRFPYETAEGRAFKNSNEAYRLLIPDYLTDTDLFYSPHSAWTLTPPAKKKTVQGRLGPGENCWAYFPNLTVSSYENLPLIASGFEKGSPGSYWPGPERKMRVLEAVMVRVDGSGKIERRINSPDHQFDYRFYGRGPNFTEIDLCKPAPGWLRADQVPLNPEG